MNNPFQENNERRQEDENDPLIRLSLSYGPLMNIQHNPHTEMLPQLTPPIQPMQPFLSLASPQLSFPLLSTQPSLVLPPISNNLVDAVPAARAVVRPRRSPTQGPGEGKSETITPPFPWATDHRATVHSIGYLLQNRIFTITGEVQCKRCQCKFQMEFDLNQKLAEVWKFIAERKSIMHDRAPYEWMNPVLPTCRHCGQENSVKPIIGEKKKKSINWLFLLLGQLLGCCTLEQLKYFCKHTKNHRTGAKDRVLYLTYLELCKQLDPNGPFIL